MTTTKLLKKFESDEEYFKDYKFVTNSQLKCYEKCPYMYDQMRKGKFVPLPKTYFDFGSAVDALLSKQKIEDLFAVGVGTKPKKSKEEAEKALEELQNEFKQREVEKKAPTQAMMKSLNSLTDTIKYWKDSEGKRVLTKGVYGHVEDVVAEILRQPLYTPFADKASQEILSTEINGIRIKGKLDKLDLKNKIICDDKTTANLKTFNPSMYLPQLAWYRMLVRIIHGVTCDCYLAVGDKYSAEGRKPRSKFYHAPSAMLDYQEEQNIILLKKLINEKDFKPCTEIIDDESEREEKCFDCDFYSECKYSNQKAYTIIV